jgi:hypothetical protein
MTDEQAPAPVSAGQAPAEQPTMTPDAARVEADRLMGDEKFSQQWQNKGPGHDFAVQKISELNRIAHGDTGTPDALPVADERTSSPDSPEQTDFTESDYINAGLGVKERTGMTEAEVENLTTTLNEVAVSSQIDPREMRTLAGEIERSISAEARNGYAHDAEATANTALESLRKDWGDSFDANLAAFQSALAATGEHKEFIGNAILRAGPSTATWAIKRLISRGRNAAR